MRNVINIYKPVGLTPLEVINKLKAKSQRLKVKRIGYAGRLDPTAHGVLILLVYPETKNRDKYQDLDKTYEFEMLLGLSTDTHDILGILDYNKLKRTSSDISVQLEKYLPIFLGKRKQTYPAYSSKPVKGKPLYKWAREGTLDKIIIPSKEVNIKSLELLDIKTVLINSMKKEIVSRIGLVSGDFRQKEILIKWNMFFGSNKGTKVTKVKMKLDCSSGTYVRAITHEIGEKLGTGAICFDILRTRVGNYHLEESKYLK